MYENLFRMKEFPLVRSPQFRGFTVSNMCFLFVNNLHVTFTYIKTYYSAVGTCFDSYVATLWDQRIDILH